MFYLSEIEHSLRLPPHRLSLPLDEALKLELEGLFLDKVVEKLGLCVSVYDIRQIDDGFIHPGEGASTYTVRFRMIMFRPFVGEIITAKLKDSNKDGLRLTLGFFDDIYIPASLLPDPSHSEPDPENKNQVRWFWDYSEQAFLIDGEDEIRFRVHSLDYPPIRTEQNNEAKSFAQQNNEAEPFAQQNNEAEPYAQQNNEAKPFAPMVIKGTIDGDGLGPITWWPE